MEIPIIQNGDRREMTKNPHEWLKQADYDMKTAEIMFDNKIYIYAVFMCHGALCRLLICDYYLNAKFLHTR